MIPQRQRETAISPAHADEWSLATRIGFRFAFIYFFLYISPGAIGALGVGEKRKGYQALFGTLWQQLVPWVGTHILGIKTYLKEWPTGSGDQVFDYVLILCIFLISCLGTVIWSILDNKRTSYPQLYEWLRLAMRLLLVTAMLTYGTSKLFPMQFAEVGIARQLDPLGHLSPMELLWVFMGYSKGYIFFCGIAEMLGGLLLIVPRFTTVGALVTLAAVSNVLALNLFYDVPRKIFTTHLALTAVFLILPDLRRLTNLFFLNRPTEPTKDVPWLKDQQLNRGVLGLQYLYCAAILAVTLHISYVGAVDNARRIESPMRGAWFVDQYVYDNVAHPPLMTDEQRWQNVVFERPEFLAIQPMQGKLQLWKMQRNGNHLTLENADDPKQHGTLEVQMPDKDVMVANGEMDGHRVKATLHRIDLSDSSRFQLTNIPFRWTMLSPLWR